jgi:hypothetical protein
MDSDKDLLDGVVRATWVSTVRQLDAGLRVVEALSRRMDAMVIKGAALIASGLAASSRRISDVDLLIRADSLPRALELLQEEGFTPLLGATPNIIENRYSLRRDGWNFQDDKGTQIDLHWRFGEFGGRPLKTDETVWEYSLGASVLGNPVIAPAEPCSAAYSVYHAFMRGSARDHLQSLVDLHFLLERANPSEVLEWGQQLRVEPQVLGSLSLVHELSASPRFSAITHWPLSYPTPPAEPWIQRAPTNGLLTRVWPWSVKRRTRAVESRSLFARPRAYRVWEVLGKSPLLERVLLWFGPLSRLTHTSLAETTYDLSNCSDVAKICGPGWSWTDPGDRGTWTDGPDARIVVQVPKGSTGRVNLHLSGAWNRPVSQDGHFSANPRGSIYVNGAWACSYDVWDSLQENPISLPFVTSTRNWVEISIRPDTWPDPSTLSPVYEGWKRSLLVGRVDVICETA